MPDLTAIVGASRTLIEGQRLDQPTFHALYEAMPAGTRAELINGVVFMPSPVGPAHGRAHFPTMSYGSCYGRGISLIFRRARTASTGLKYSPDYGWIHRPSSRATRELCELCSTAASPSPNMPSSSRAWPARITSANRSLKLCQMLNKLPEFQRALGHPWSMAGGVREAAHVGGLSFAFIGHSLP
jgi:hypothetical protein